MNIEEKKQKGFYYYCKELTSKEIGKLLDTSYRTVQNWMHKESWKVKRNDLKQAKQNYKNKPL